MGKENFLDKLKKVLKKIFYKQPKATEANVNVSQPQDLNPQTTPENPQGEQEVYEIKTNVELAPNIKVVDDNAQNANQPLEQKNEEPHVLIGDEKPQTEEIVTHVSMFGDEKVEDLPQETLDVAEPKVTLGEPIEWKKPEAEVASEQPLMFDDNAPAAQNNEASAPQTEPEKPLMFGDGEKQSESTPQIEPTQPTEQLTSEQPLWFGDPIKEETPTNQEPVAPVDENSNVQKPDLCAEGPNDPRIFEEPIYKGSEVNQPTQVEPTMPAEQIAPVETSIPAEPITPAEPVINEPVVPAEPITPSELVAPAENSTLEQPQIQEQPLMFGDPAETIQPVTSEPSAPVQSVPVQEQPLHFPGIDPDFGEQGGPSAPGLK